MFEGLSKEPDAFTLACVCLGSLGSCVPAINAAFADADIGDQHPCVKVVRELCDHGKVLVGDPHQTGSVLEILLALVPWVQAMQPSYASAIVCDVSKLCLDALAVECGGFSLESVLSQAMSVGSWFKGWVWVFYLARLCLD